MIIDLKCLDTKLKTITIFEAQCNVNAVATVLAIEHWLL